MSSVVTTRPCTLSTQSMGIMSVVERSVDIILTDCGIIDSSISSNMVNSSKVKGCNKTKPSEDQHNLWTVYTSLPPILPHMTYQDYHDSG